MSISNIAGTGIVIDLDIYTPQRPRPESPDFWHLQNQLRLQEWLRPFLPKMAYNQETNQVTASMVEDSKELLSYSTALTVDNMPLEDLAKLEKVVIELRTRITREEVEPDTKMLIENFSLPDPDSAPELYRVFGTPEHPRLAILWGMAKNGAPSIMLKDFSAARFLKGGGVTGKPRKRSKWLWILLLIAAAGIAYYTQSGKDDTEPVTIGGGNGDTPSTAPVAGNGGNGEATSGGTDTEPVTIGGGNGDTPSTAPVADNGGNGEATSGGTDTEPVTISGTQSIEEPNMVPVTIAAPEGTSHHASVRDTQGYPVSLQAETTEPARFVDTVGNPVDTAPGAAVKAYPNGLLTVTSDDGLETPVFVQTQSGEPVNAVVVKQDADGKPAATPVMAPAHTETGKPVSNVRDSRGNHATICTDSPKPVRLVTPNGQPVPEDAEVKEEGNGLLSAIINGIKEFIFPETPAGDPVSAVVVTQGPDGKPAATPVMAPAHTETGKPVSNVQDSRGNHATICTDSPKPVRLVTPNGQPVPEDAEVKEEGNGLLSAIINGIKEFIFPETPEGEPVNAVVVKQDADGKPAATPVMAPAHTETGKPVSNVRDSRGNHATICTDSPKPVRLVTPNGQPVPENAEVKEEGDGMLSAIINGIKEFIFPETPEGEPVNAVVVKQDADGKPAATPVMMPARTETGKPVSNVQDSRGNHATICTDSPKPVRLVTPNGQPVPENAEVKEEGDGMLSAIINGIKEFIFPETPAGDPVSAVVVTQGPDGKPAATPVMAPVRVGPEQDMPNIKGPDGSPRVLVATPEQAKQGPATFVNVDGQKVPVTKETPMTEQKDGTLTVQLPGKAPETVYPVTGGGKPYSCTTVQSIPGKGLVTRKVVVVLVSREVPYTLDKTAEETLENGNVKVTFSIAPSHGSKLKSAKLNGQPVDLATGTVTVELNPSTTKWVQVDVTTEDGRPHTNTHDIRFQQQ